MTDGDDITVLCVDPETATADTVANRAEIRAVPAEDVAAGREAAAATDVDCVVAEYDLPDGTGFDVFEAVRESHPNAACILYTEADRAEIDTGAFRDTVAEFLPKDSPNAGDRLVDMVHIAVVDRTQVGFPLPDDEDARLDALAAYDVESFDAVETFDRLSKLVASHFDIRVAFVGLLHEIEERFVACHGADWETLDREDSICTYAILDDEVTVIENVQADPRFAYNETLKELEIRSYAGANITTPDGTVIGELCLVHDEPRSYDDAGLADLQRFAEEVSEQLELRRRLASGEDER
ncbi:MULTISPECIES: GAF domain-containing protein [Salinibaculum]|uniref:GAF domain-containing protein n=1 Tax=Salinibaculum TaxID=2732368 RepID=UPI0030CD0020